MLSKKHQKVALRAAGLVSGTSETIRLLKETEQMFNFIDFPPRAMIFFDENAAKHGFLKNPSAAGFDFCFILAIFVVELEKLEQMKDGVDI